MGISGGGIDAEEGEVTDDVTVVVGLSTMISYGKVVSAEKIAGVVEPFWLCISTLI